MTHRYYWCLLCVLVIISACSVPGSRLFSKRTPHEVYGSRLKDAGLAATALGQSWYNAAVRSLQQPVPVTVPYKETGYFAAEKPTAAGFIFDAKKGQLIQVRVSAEPSAGFLLFTDLFEAKPGGDPKFLEAADTSNLHIEYEVNSDGKYLLRIQPELLKNGSYTVIISDSASLNFPVQAANDPRVGSFWGNSRDGGARNHEGIDIFAAFRTPVVAAADGLITRVGENGLGGKVIFLRPYRKNYSLYYAHLDSQLVRTGQAVRAGDTLGLMGNTGNAKTTPPHLHFGIYAAGGPVDPLPFVKSSGKNPENITASLDALNQYGQNNRDAFVYSGPSTKNAVIEKITSQTPFRVLAASANWYKVILPGEKTGFISSGYVEAGKPLRRLQTDSTKLLVEDAFDLATPKMLLAKGKEVEILGEYEGFYLAKADSVTGWMKR